MNSPPGKREKSVKRLLSVMQSRMRSSARCSCLPVKGENDRALPKRQASGVSRTEALALGKRTLVESHSSTILFLALEKSTKDLPLRMHKTTSQTIYADRYRPRQEWSAHCCNICLHQNIMSHL